MKRVGLIGAGRMGKPMAGLWLKAGYAVDVFDAQSEAMEALVSAGATAHRSPASVAANAEVVVVLVGFPPQVADCMNRSDGVLAGLQSGATVVVSSTTDPTQVIELAQAVRMRGGDLLDAPIARAEQAAYDADVLWFAGGTAATLERVRDVLAVCGPDIHHVGDVGAGQVAKAVNNMLLWAAVISNRRPLHSPNHSASTRTPYVRPCSTRAPRAGPWVIGTSWRTRRGHTRTWCSSPAWAIKPGSRCRWPACCASASKIAGTNDRS